MCRGLLASTQQSRIVRHRVAVALNGRDARRCLLRHTHGSHLCFKKQGHALRQRVRRGAVARKIQHDDERRLQRRQAIRLVETSVPEPGFSMDPVHLARNLKDARVAKIA